MATVRSMTHADLREVSAIHMAAFEGFFLTRMGPGFLRAYYEAVLDFPHGICLVSCDSEQGDVHGFAVGFQQSADFYRMFAARRWRLAPVIAGALIRRPRLMLDIASNILRVRARGRPSPSMPSHGVELSSIAVRAAGTGIGQSLLTAFLDIARVRGESRVFLTTDADGNDAVRRFYEKAGFILEGHQIRRARRLCLYSLALPPVPSEDGDVNPDDPRR